MNKLLVSYLRSYGNDLETVQFSVFCYVLLLNNPFFYKSKEII